MDNVTHTAVMRRLQKIATAFAKKQNRDYTPCLSPELQPADLTEP